MRSMIHLSFPAGGPCSRLIAAIFNVCQNRCANAQTIASLLGNRRMELWKIGGRLEAASNSSIQQKAAQGQISRGLVIADE